MAVVRLVRLSSAGSLQYDRSVTFQAGHWFCREWHLYKQRIFLYSLQFNLHTVRWCYPDPKSFNVHSHLFHSMHNSTTWLGVPSIWLLKSQFNLNMVLVEVN